MKREIHILDNRNRLHNKKGPAIVRYDQTGKVEKEAYYIRGDLHREDGPAIVIYRGKEIIKEWWYRLGRLHRIGAPAIIRKYPPEYHDAEEWYIIGKKCKKQDHIGDVLMKIARRNKGMVSNDDRAHCKGIISREKINKIVKNVKAALGIC